MRAFYLALLFSFGSFTTINYSKKLSLSDFELERISTHVNDVRSITGLDPKYNTKIAFLVDMKIKSGKNRFFVYDLQNNTILDQGLVAHGSGSETAVRGDLKFSNEPNSNCTSLGRYAVEKAYRGIFGKAYKLVGLDQTNSNAFKRAIVLHHYSAVPYEEQDYYISNSHGCPMVNEAFFKRLEKIIESSKTKIILDVYY
ncbi:murein L,D-transpeptidase catalytic domain-containing protein [Flavobacterium aquidurense]|uniref:Murein L,D-transpeptidase catalytic domain family protein n=1 Tax=Flavobacterium piscisymbiosum TaxID=2893753 RepID=A0ABS8MHS9_9FLAO|nr:murein L,D-transpeptidase catalytic domain family protein [Flavobacterium sp. F-30]MCC9065029.1 murein L,D-transpeptidase catalytic domain family protein [Flavobacterium sp. F-30]